MGNPLLLGLGEVISERVTTPAISVLYNRHEANKCKSKYKVTKVNVISLSVCDGYIGVPLRQGSYFHVNRIYLKGIISVLALSFEIYIK